MTGPVPGGLGRGFIPGRPSLVAYLMAGYPDRERSLDALGTVARAGADIIELGVPYADPMADGAVIREAAVSAMNATRGGFYLEDTVALAGDFLSYPRRPLPPPLALMTYLNPMMRMGYSRVAESARVAGISGFIVPDMPPEAAGPWLSDSEGLDTVFLAAPTSTPERLAKVGESSSGFVYCVSSRGVTGERSELPEELGDLVRRVKAATSLPVAVGFGVSTPEQAAEVARVADGVVVGSAIVRRQGDLEELDGFVRELADAVHGAGQA